MDNEEKKSTAEDMAWRIGRLVKYEADRQWITMQSLAKKSGLDEYVLERIVQGDATVSFLDIACAFEALGMDLAPMRASTAYHAMAFIQKATGCSFRAVQDYAPWNIENFVQFAIAFERSEKEEKVKKKKRFLFF